jgi:glycosyltransferase involved in cell wall biosynthesis
VDLVIQAFNEMPHRRLVVVGEGQQNSVLRQMAGPNVSFTGYLPRQAYVRTVSEARALVFAGCEDFGIALAEAQACGTPLIAFARGGANDIVQRWGASNRPTGILFARQTVEATKEAVEFFELHRREISPAACRDNATRFSRSRFLTEIQQAFDRTLKMHAVA